MKDTEELRAELKSLIEQRHALNLQWLKSDKERTAARLAKLEAELKAAEEKLPQAVDAEVDRLLKSVKTNKPKVTAALKDAKSKLDSQDVAVLKTAHEELTKASHKMAEELYKASSAQPNPAAPEADAGAPSILAPASMRAIRPAAPAWLRKG
jgi:chaperonin cofactor prefoldin